MPCDPGCLPPVSDTLKFGDSFNSLDLRVTKAIRFGEQHRVDLIAEGFNLFNITNIRGSDRFNIGGFSNVIDAANFNQALVTAGGFFGSGGPRAFQFVARYSF